MAGSVREAVELCEQGRWLDARAAFDAVRADALAPVELEWLAIACELTGDNEEAQEAWEKAHHAWLEVEDIPRAVRVAFWVGIGLHNLGRNAPAHGWFARGQRLLDGLDEPCAEHARLLVPQALQHLGRDPARALEIFEEAATLAGRFDDREVSTLTILGSGQARMRMGDVAGGVALLDEALVAAMAGDVMPIAVGIVYCAVIIECNRVFDLRRAREWTAELDRWTSRQQGLVPFSGQCLIHRSEMAQYRGDWDLAVDEAVSACRELSDPRGDPLLGLALYQRAELHRLRGDFDRADEDYRRAASLGRREEPGRQLMLLAQGKVDEAMASIRAAADVGGVGRQRALVLAAHVEIHLAAGDIAGAQEGLQLLLEQAQLVGTDQARAIALHWEGAVLLAAGQPDEALDRLRSSEELWLAMAVPYEVARTHALQARAHDARGDEQAAARLRESAADIHEQLGAVTDLAALSSDAAAPDEVPGGLSPREAEVIELVATGMTNRQIAERLVISEKTVARHVSNIFTKLGVTSRSAATAWAFENGLASS